MLPDLVRFGAHAALATASAPWQPRHISRNSVISLIHMNVVASSAVAMMFAPRFGQGTVTFWRMRLISGEKSTSRVNRRHSHHRAVLFHASSASHGDMRALRALQRSSELASLRPFRSGDCSFDLLLFIYLYNVMILRGP